MARKGENIYRRKDCLPDRLRIPRSLVEPIRFGGRAHSGGFLEPNGQASRLPGIPLGTTEKYQVMLDTWHLTPLSLSGKIVV